MKSCGNLNFARRDQCNRCEAPKPKDDSKKASEIGHAAAKNSRGLFRYELETFPSEEILNQHSFKR